MYLERRQSSTGAATVSTDEFWSQNFSRTRAFSKRHQRLFAKDPCTTLIRAHVVAGGHVLDAGCGAGHWVVFLNRLGYDCEGLDFSDDLNKRLESEFPALQWHLGDVRNMPLDAGGFDAIVSWGVIEHDEQGPESALREFHRILRPGGCLIVTVPIDSARQRQASRLSFGRESSGAFFQYFFTPEELAARVASCEFLVKEAGPLPIRHAALAFPRLWARMSHSRLMNKALMVAAHGTPLSVSANMVYCCAAAE